MATYKYDVFVSYASKDRQWADKLRKLLEANDLKVFLDSERLVPGKEWELQVHDALEASRHLIVLWSNNAKSSDWVNKEMSYFDVKNRLDETRQLIIIVLEDEPKAFMRLQIINEIKEKDVYKNGVESVDDNLWNLVVKRIKASLKNNENDRPIRLAVLTTTRKRLEEEDFEKVPELGESLSNILQQSGLGITKNRILENYGDEFKDWKPFGGSKNIDTILDELLIEINKITKRFNVAFNWERLDSKHLWAQDLSEVEEELRQLSENPAVIIIDPIALYIDSVRARFEMCDRCFENNEALIMAFSPFTTSADLLSWRMIIQNKAYRFHSNFFDPPIPKKDAFAEFCANPIDRKDAKRLLQFVLSNKIREDLNFKRSNNSPFLKMS